MSRSDAHTPLDLGTKSLMRGALKNGKKESGPLGPLRGHPENGAGIKICMAHKHWPEDLALSIFLISWGKVRLDFRLVLREDDLFI